MPQTQKQPLTDIRILDLSQLYPAPLGTMMLAEMGAEVIKIERPDRPDPMRQYPPFIHGQSSGYLAVNRGKKSLCLNYDQAEGQTILKKLVKTADIMVDSFRPGVMTGLGLDYETLSKLNPKLIYISTTGYGQTGPRAKQAGHDLNYIGYAGILGEHNCLPQVQMADVAGGAYMTVIAALMGLMWRQQTQKGQHLDVAMLDSVLPLMTLPLAHHWAKPQTPIPDAMLSGALACYHIYICADQRRLALAALETKFWKNFCNFAQRPDWQDKHFSNGPEKDQLVKEIQDFFAAKPRDQWLEETQGLDICLTPILSIDEVANDPQLRARQMIKNDPHWGTYMNTPLNFEGKQKQNPAPPLGQHNQEILNELKP